MPVKKFCGCFMKLLLTVLSLLERLAGEGMHRYRTTTDSTRTPRRRIGWWVEGKNAHTAYHRLVTEKLWTILVDMKADRVVGKGQECTHSLSPTSDRETEDKFG